MTVTVEKAHKLIKDYLEAREALNVARINNYPTFDTSELLRTKNDLIEAMTVITEPEGWQLVPKKATPKMLEGYRNALRLLINDAIKSGTVERFKLKPWGRHVPPEAKARARYEAMLNEAPQSTLVKR